MNYAHFLYTPFTGLGSYGGYRGDKWLIDRINIFKRFVLPSIMNQFNQDFVLWISWRPEDRESPIVQAFVESLMRVRDLNILHTYGGIMFYDDKYPEEEASRRLLESLKSTLPELQPWVVGKDAVLVTIQPSDDLYLSDMVERHQKFFKEDEEGFQAIGYTRGYIANYATKEIAEYSCAPWRTDSTSTYHTDTNPPFYSVRFPVEVFLDPEKHYKFIGPYKSHEFVGDYLKKYDIPDYRGFVVGTHGANISTTWHHRYKGATLSQDEQVGIMIKTGILFSDPYRTHKGCRLYLRDVFNKIPLQEPLRKLYHKLPTRWQRL